MFLYLGVASQTSIEMMSVSCQTKMSGEDLLRMEHELQEVRHQMHELRKRTQCVLEELDSWKRRCSQAEQRLKYSHIISPT